MVTDSKTGAGESNDELATLARLRDYEQELSRRLEEAKREAETRLSDAREAAARLEAQEDADRGTELARLRGERARHVETELAAVRDETARQVATLTHRAAVNRERALARLVAAVSASGTP